MIITLYHLHTAGGSHMTASSATQARRFLQSGRNLARLTKRPEGSTFGRWVLVATYDNGRPVHTRIYPARKEGTP